MKLSLILTVNRRSKEVSKAVADSLTLPGNQPDELIVVLDRPEGESDMGALEAYGPLGAKFITLDGEPGWKGPARAWNAGFQAATGDLLYLISSEVVQDEGNLQKARRLMRLECNHGDAIDVQCSECGGSGINRRPKKQAIFGACHNSEPLNLVVGAEPGVLVSSRMTRPLGFIACLPAKAVREIGGFDEDFMGGFWYDDDDFFLRLWNSGLDFLFTDDIHGIHQHHERPDLETKEGQAGINRNRDLMMKKHHGICNPWPGLERIEEHSPGTTLWRHQ